MAIGRLFLISPLTAVALIGVVMAGNAGVESTSDALRAFGLSGVYAVDCAKDATQESASRITYVIPPSGSPYATNVTRTQGYTFTWKSEFRSAARVTEDKLKYTLVLTEKRILAPQAGEKEKVEKGEAVYNGVIQKFGSKIRTMERHMEGGRDPTTIENGEMITTMPSGNVTHQPSPLMEKCLVP